MGARGRKSKNDVIAVSQAATAVFETVERPDAPYDLTDEQSEVWRSVVSAFPADWFDAGSYPMLSAYCRHVVTQRHLAQLIVECERAGADGEFDVKEYGDLLRLQVAESQRIESLATKMRISPQATTNHRGNKKPRSGPLPWSNAQTHD